MSLQRNTFIQRYSLKWWQGINSAGIILIIITEMPHCPRRVSDESKQKFGCRSVPTHRHLRRKLNTESDAKDKRRFETNDHSISFQAEISKLVLWVCI